MYTQCTHCDESYSVSPTQLSLSRGQCQCPHCGKTFNALERLSKEPHNKQFEAPAPLKEPLRLVPRKSDEFFDELLDEGEENTPADRDQRIEPTFTPAEHIKPTMGQTFSKPMSASELLDEPKQELAPAAKQDTAPPQHTPNFSRRRRKAQRTDWPWWLGCTALALSMAGLVVAHKFDDLSADKRFRPHLAKACGLVGCSLPPWHEPKSLVMTYSELEKSDEHPDALKVAVSFRNEAPFPQVWPQMEVTLTDFDGTPMARRRFSANQYLKRTPKNTLASWQTVNVNLTLKDPGIESVAYVIELK